MNEIEKMIQQHSSTIDENLRKMIEGRLWLEKKQEVERLDDKISVLKDKESKLQTKKEKVAATC